MKIFNSMIKVFPLFTLFDFNMLEGLRGFIVGTTNQMMLNHNRIKFDIAINLDTQKIMISNDIPEKYLKMSKEDKNIYNKVFNTIKDNYKEDEAWMISMNYFEPMFDGSDDFIRNEIKNYFFKLITDFDLLINLINSDGENLNLKIEENGNESEEVSDHESEGEDKKKSKIFLTRKNKIKRKEKQ